MEGVSPAGTLSVPARSIPRTSDMSRPRKVRTRDLPHDGDDRGMGPPDPNEVVRDTASDLAQLASDLNRTKGEARH